MQEAAMTTMTIRNLDDDLKRRLRIRAAEHGRSMEAEMREILRTALAEPSESGGDFAERAHQRFAAAGGVDLPEVERGPARDVPQIG
jgi:plasmid stability protein